MTRDQLLEKVFAQLEQDIENRDYTAIEEMLARVPNETLIAYLPEEMTNA
jgi:hypothetical protein